MIISVGRLIEGTDGHNRLRYFGQTTHCSDTCSGIDSKYYAIADQKCGVVCLNPIYYTFAKANQPGLKPSSTNTPCQDYGYNQFINQEKKGFAPITVCIDFYSPKPTEEIQ